MPEFGRIQDYKKIKRSAGPEYIITNEEYCMKILIIEPGYQSSYHYHPKKDETFICVAGEVTIKTETQDFFLKPLHSVRMFPGEAHRFINNDNDIAILVEASTHSYEEDNEKLIYGGKIE